MTKSPKTPVSIVKFKKYSSQAGLEIAKSLKDVLVDIVSETVKNLFGDNIRRATKGLAILGLDRIKFNFCTSILLSSQARPNAVQHL